MFKRNGWIQWFIWHVSILYFNTIKSILNLPISFKTDNTPCTFFFFFREMIKIQIKAPYELIYKDIMKK